MLQFCEQLTPWNPTKHSEMNKIEGVRNMKKNHLLIIPLLVLKWMLNEVMGKFQIKKTNKQTNKQTKKNKQKNQQDIHVKKRYPNVIIIFFFKSLPFWHISPSHPGRHLPLQWPVTLWHTPGFPQVRLQFLEQLFPNKPTAHSVKCESKYRYSNNLTWR